MKIEVAERKENPLMKRSEFLLAAVFQGPTPRKNEMKKHVAQAVKGDEGLIVIKNIGMSFGASKARVAAFLYQDAASMKAYEPPEKKKEAKKEEKKEEEKKK